ncbi:rhomboid family intramembrane serine protease [Aestuariirhabdus sp. Z084]|uniref:rhomboid family intramembrane serine protease n=1 Tax=Aestuariirhabdus haliotis TaxID=2918751 RepID=UPI00201B40E3|nr:rhomboid family intramembrane serine protease [Aestuariirhabdus haliotis]MCL6417373.1 rhomboid family intramembrane serine protease [Aestuariirhabdus haliotis]MCL6421330.1 rhomboid family intramembrane serine protease [Aestuariirhabdus haliotis]
MARHASCPSCDKQYLDTTTCYDEELDVCRACGGHWFEHDELNRVLSRVDNGHNEADYQQQLGPVLGISDRPCPEGHGRMQSHQLLAQYQVSIDICEQCQGVWVDSDELHQVKQSPAIQQTLGTLNKGLSWKSRVFQFLSQMPVEYNVKPKRKPLVTWTLIALNCLIFLSYVTNPELGNQLIMLFGNVPTATLAGEQPWTLISCIFLHGDTLHLLGNMYFLYVVGDNIEDALGRRHFIMLYLGLGLLSSLISVGMNWHSDIPSIGASGAIAGLFGVYLIWFRNASLTFMIFIFQKKLSPIWYFAIWVGLNVAGMVVDEGGIDYWAHIGGFVSGLLIGYILKPYIFKRNPLLEMLAHPAAVVSR